jgi:hypothetical protein
MMPNSAFHRTARRRRFACPLAAGERRRSATDATEENQRTVNT